ncbi:MAG: DUF4286 domain-containing protein [Chitinophagaceae bacterium]
MVVYNLTIKVNAEIVEEWMEWLKKEHIPEVMTTGQFTDYKFFRLLEQDETEGTTFVVQYFANSLNHYNQYLSMFAPALRDKSVKKWGNRFIAFRSVMEVVH